MRFTIFEFGGKEQHLRQQLLNADHQETVAVDGVLTTDFDLLLVDCDWPWAHPRPLLIEGAKRFGAKVATYPHGGRPTAWVYDGIAEPDDRVDVRLEHGPGSLQILEDDLSQEATGWLFSPTRDFQPVEKPKKILFAPLHANIEAIVKGHQNGHDPAPLLNQGIYRRLLEMRDIEVTVSVASPQWRTGVWPHPRARIIHNPSMRFEQSLRLIDEADVVVAAGTMAAAAVARGKPTVMFDQDTFADYVGGQYVEAHHQDRYSDLVRYPLDTDDGPLADLISQACAAEQSGWRQLWVGHDGAENAVRVLEGLVQPTPLVQSNVVIQGATARSSSRS